MVAASGFYFSCGDKMNKNTGSSSIAYKWMETAHLFSDTAKCNLVIDFTYRSSIGWIAERYPE